MEELYLQAKTSKKALGELFIKVERLLYHTIRGYAMPMENRQSIVHMSFMKAFNKYDINSGYKFSTYASACALNEAKMYCREVLKKSNTMTVSYEECLAEDTQGNTLTIYDTIEGDISPEDKYIEKMDIKLVLDCIKKLTPDNQRIIQLHLANVPQREIAKEFGLTQAYVSRKIRKVLLRVKKMYEYRTAI